MKVIVAGLPKTGTTSMHEALKILGYNVYDYPENFWYLGKEWTKVLTEGIRIDLSNCFQERQSLVFVIDTVTVRVCFCYCTMGERVRGAAL